MILIKINDSSSYINILYYVYRLYLNNYIKEK